MSTQLTINVGEYLFEFHSKQHWVNKGYSWFRRCVGLETIAVDAVGRVCTVGSHFSRAENEGAYPIRVYLVDKELEA